MAGPSQERRKDPEENEDAPTFHAGRAYHWGLGGPAGGRGTLPLRPSGKDWTNSCSLAVCREHRGPSSGPLRQVAPGPCLRPDFEPGSAPWSLHCPPRTTETLPKFSADEIEGVCRNLQGQAGRGTASGLPGWRHSDQPAFRMRDALRAGPFQERPPWCSQATRQPALHLPAWKPTVGSGKALL